VLQRRREEPADPPESICARRRLGRDDGRRIAADRVKAGSPRRDTFGQSKSWEAPG
jgi:hypothetical protein